MRTFVSLPAPRPRIFKVFATWMLEKKPLYSKEMSFLDQSSDLITLAEGQERGWLDGVVENLLAWCASINILQVGSSCVAVISDRCLPGLRHCQFPRNDA